MGLLEKAEIKRQADCRSERVLAPLYGDCNLRLVRSFLQRFIGIAMAALLLLSIASLAEGQSPDIASQIAALFLLLSALQQPGRSVCGEQTEPTLSWAIWDTHP